MRSSMLGAAEAALAGLLVCAAFVAGSFADAVPAHAAPAEATQIPTLNWQQRSDWVNVKTAITPAAVGDGKADDTAAIQKAFDSLVSGVTIYFPPGTYRITGTLNIKSPRIMGGRIIGCGHATRLVWDGAAAGTMVQLDGYSGSIIEGLELDGQGKGGVGFRYKSETGFQTEVTHRNLAFLGFTDAGILEDPTRRQALAEVSFENCLFENCGRGVAFLQFNDYDYTFDGDLFRNCGTAVECNHGNFYIRDCRFEGSTIADIKDHSEHDSTVRRCTSQGSNAFLVRTTSVAPMTVQDCHVDGWKSPQGALQLSGPPVLIMDCVFTNPPRDARGLGSSPVRATAATKLIVSQNRAEGSATLVDAAAAPKIYEVPAGREHGVVTSAGQSFLRSTAHIPGKIFDAVVDFGAKPNGTGDSTDAIQHAIDAASAAGGDAMAYLPTGRYAITRTLQVTGHDYFVGGSGWSTKLLWRGAEGGTMMEVRDANRVTLQNMDVGSHDGGKMNNAIDIREVGTGKASHVTYDGVYAFGLYDKKPYVKGFHFEGLGAGDVVVMPHVQGNLHFIDSAAATILGNCTYEGSVVVEGKGTARGGLLGFQTRLATGVTYGLYLLDNQSIVMSDFYMEQSDNGYLMQGGPGLPPGRATIQGAKFHSFESTDPEKNTFMDIKDYSGEVFYGPDQFYGEPKLTRIRQEGPSDFKLYFVGCSWFGPAPDPHLSASGHLLFVGNSAYGMSNKVDVAAQPTASIADAMPEGTLAAMSRGLDDLRRLGRADMQLNHGPRPN